MSKNTKRTTLSFLGGSYSLTGDEISHAREEISTAEFRTVPPRRRDTRIKNKSFKQPSPFPSLEEESCPRDMLPSNEDLWRVSILNEDEAPTQIHSPEDMERVMRADREEFRSRKAFEMLTTTMTPTLKAVMDLPSAAFVSYLQARPHLWLEDESVEDVRAWVWHKSPRYRVVERFGVIENKPDAFDRIATAEATPLGKTYMNLVDTLDY